MLLRQEGRAWLASVRAGCVGDGFGRIPGRATGNVPAPNRTASGSDTDGRVRRGGGGTRITTGRIGCAAVCWFRPDRRRRILCAEWTGWRRETQWAWKSLSSLKKRVKCSTAGRETQWGHKLPSFSQLGQKSPLEPWRDGIAWSWVLTVPSPAIEATHGVGVSPTGPALRGAAQPLPGPGASSAGLAGRGGSTGPDRRGRGRRVRSPRRHRRLQAGTGPAPPGPGHRAGTRVAAWRGGRSGRGSTDAGRTVRDAAGARLAASRAARALRAVPGGVGPAL